MSAWTVDDWIKILGAMGGFVTLLGTSVTAIILQLRNTAKTEAARAIGVDNSQKLNAVVRQTNELARADPNASTAPTDAIINTATAMQTRRASDPIT